MALKVANNAVSTLAGTITNSQTTLVLQGGTGARFPSLAVGDYFYATLVAPTGEIEIVKVTARVSDTLTVIRAQESTTAFAFLAGAYIANHVTAAQLMSFFNLDNDGSGSGLDADKVDGFHAAQAASANTVAVRDANGKLAGDILGNAATAGNAALLDGYDSSVSATANTVAVRDANGKLAGDILGNAATATNATNATNVSGGTVSSLDGGNLAQASTTVRGTATVATTAEAQAQSSDIDMLTPAKLAAALQGLNQSLTANGYQKLPGGLIIQWGTYTANGSGKSVTFPVAFPTVAAVIVGVIVGTNATANVAVTTRSTTGFSGDDNASGRADWIAIGY